VTHQFAFVARYQVATYRLGNAELGDNYKVKEMYKYVTPSWGNPPHAIIGDISDNYQRISTKFEYISLQTKSLVLVHF